VSFASCYATPEIDTQLLKVFYKVTTISKVTAKENKSKSEVVIMRLQTGAA